VGGVEKPVNERYRGGGGSRDGARPAARIFTLSLPDVLAGFVYLGRLTDGPASETAPSRHVLPFPMRDCLVVAHHSRLCPFHLMRTASSSDYTTSRTLQVSLEDAHARPGRPTCDAPVAHFTSASLVPSIQGTLSVISLITCLCPQLSATLARPALKAEHLSPSTSSAKQRRHHRPKRVQKGKPMGIYLSGVSTPINFGPTGEI
jgi:hypothetical protein